MTGTDIKEKLVDCNLAIAMGISGIIFNFLVYGKTGVFDSIIGLLIGVIILELIARSGYLLLVQEQWAKLILMLPEL